MCLARNLVNGICKKMKNKYIEKKLSIYHNLDNNSKRMSYLQKIWAFTGTMNFVYIYVRNTLNAIKMISQEEETKHWKTKQNRPLPNEDNVKHWLSYMKNCLGCLCIVHIKSLIFYYAGPIGTYRIWLAYYNAYVTNNTKWTDVINKSYPHINDVSYIVKPIGYASWFPIKHENEKRIPHNEKQS